MRIAIRRQALANVRPAGREMTAVSVFVHTTNMAVIAIKRATVMRQIHTIAIRRRVNVTARAVGVALNVIGHVHSSNTVRVVN